MIGARHVIIFSENLEHIYGSSKCKPKLTLSTTWRRFQILYSIAPACLRVGESFQRVMTVFDIYWGFSTFSVLENEWVGSCYVVVFRSKLASMREYQLFPGIDTWHVATPRYSSPTVAAVARISTKDCFVTAAELRCTISRRTFIENTNVTRTLFCRLGAYVAMLGSVYSRYFFLGTS